MEQFSEATERDLITLALKDDADAFAALVMRYRSGVIRASGRRAAFRLVGCAHLNADAHRCRDGDSGFALFVPVVGWFLLLPLTAFAGLGAVVVGLISDRKANQSVSQ